MFFEYIKNEINIFIFYKNLRLEKIMHKKDKYKW